MSHAAGPSPARASTIDDLLATIADLSSTATLRGDRASARILTSIAMLLSEVQSSRLMADWALPDPLAEVAEVD